ncbi:MAG: hypothetical protein EHM40_05820 [Chloroflexi bacterium]|nr:MAG: hypothetical protein EHM40_05820 [Chloroflexota bacterium]
MISLIKLFAVIVFAGVAIFPVYAFASSSSGAKASGEGAATISGWTTSDVHYRPSNDPSRVESVNFDLDAPASTVSVKLSSTSTAYTSCTNLNTYHWQCDFPSGVSIASMDEFRVIAVGN